ncbi:MAG: amidohydrolase family protein [Paracoccaceae bacterium]
MTTDLTIRNARILTPEGEVTGDLAVAGGRIAAIGPGLSTALPRAAAEIDAGGLLLLPGGIDSHCHMDQRPVNGEGVHPDDFTTATSAAAAGGVTTVIPQSMSGRGDDIAANLREYLAKAGGRAVVDYSAIIQMPEADPAFLSATLPRLVDEGFPTLKIFTTYEGYTLSDAEILRVLEAAAPLGVLSCIHAEDDALLTWATAKALREGRTGLTEQPKARPVEGEAGMIARVATYARVTGAAVHVYHVTGRLPLAAIAEAQALGARVTGETCPQYLTFSEDDLDRPDFDGARFLASPALRGAEDRAALWAALADGGLASYASDHSPSHRMAKIARAQERAARGEATPFTEMGGGSPGLQVLLPVLFSEGVVRGRIGLDRFAELTAGAPARLFGLAGRKGRIAVGYDADLVLWDPAQRWTVRQADMLSRVDFTPWEGMELTGRPVMTFVRGRLVAEDGTVADGAVGHGRLVFREQGAA